MPEVMASPSEIRPYDGAVHDELLSRAVIVYVWGSHGQPWPSRHPDAVKDRFGGEAAELLPRVEGIEREMHQDPRQWFAADEATTGGRVSQALRSRHPELTDEAIEALAAQFTYSYR